MSLLSPLRIAQVTDLHLFADDTQRLLGLSTLESFRAVLQQVMLLDPKPDLLLLTGDLSQDGKSESYQLLRGMLAPLAIPTYWLPGNHDFLPAMESVLDYGVISPQKSFRFGDWRFLLLNSQVSGRVHGYLTNESLEWLDHQLKMTNDQPTIIGLHHPPFVVGSDWLDGSRLQNPDDLFALVDRYPQVKLVLFGHVHQEYSHQRNGVQYFGTPSTCIQFKPGSTDFALGEQCPGFRVIHLYPDGSWWTTVERTSYYCSLNLAAKGY